MKRAIFDIIISVENKIFVFFLRKDVSFLEEFEAKPWKILRLKKNF